MSEEEEEYEEEQANYLNEYWTKYDFSDERLIFTPIYENKLQKYINTVFDNYGLDVVFDSLVYRSSLLFNKMNSKLERKLFLG